MDPVAERVFEFALRAYHNGDVETAVEYFSKSLNIEATNWQCRFYLAMSYYRSARVSEAANEFASISDLCPDRDLRAKASAFVSNLHSTVSQGYGKSA